MAKTDYGVNDAMAVQTWSKMLATEALKATAIKPLIGTDSSSIIHQKNETKSGGDKVTFGLRMQLNGDGVTEGQVLEGNEEALTTYADSVVINQLRHATRSEANDTISQQRVPFNIRAECKDGLVDWVAKRLSVSFFNQACGYTVQSSTLYTGLNAVTAPSANRQIWADSADAGHNGDEDLTSADIMKLEYIDYARERAKTATVPLRPVKINGEEKYVMYLHPYQVVDLRNDTSTGAWRDIQMAALSGGQISKNPLYTGALGEYNGVILREAFDVTQGVHSSTGAAETDVRRAVFLGAQSCALAFGSNFSTGAPYKWVEKFFDYENELGVSIKMLWGMKKTAFNSEDFGTIVVSTYAAAHG